MPRFVLASTSPARLATLRAAGVEPEVVPSNVDESSVRADSPATLVRLLAERKAGAVASNRTNGAAAALVLGCDSLLELGGQTLGKPGSPEAAAQRWRQLRGRHGILHTGHCLIDTGTGAQVSRTGAAGVRFANVNDAEIDAYCATGEPTAVAGAFTIDGFGGWFVERVDGDPHNVVGVSLPIVRGLLGELGYGLTDIGWPAPR